MTNPIRYQKRQADIRRRIATAKPEFGRCRIFECDQLTTATKGKGLNRLYCRRHVDRFRRHGSYFKSSYRVADLNPYRRSAEEWLRRHMDNAVVREAVDAINMLYWRGGHPQEAFRLRGLPPADRAKYAWARLRQRKVDPTEPLAAWLAVEMKIRDDIQPDRHREYKQVQAAKLVHRMAGGSHKRWEHELDGRKYTTELHKHPASRGLVLRHIGQQLEKAARGLVDTHLSTIHHAHKEGPTQGRGGRRERS
jgi:hypothetical protein